MGLPALTLSERHEAALRVSLIIAMIEKARGKRDLEEERFRQREATLAAELSSQWRDACQNALKEIFQVIPENINITEDAKALIEDSILSALGPAFGSSPSVRQQMKEYIAEAYSDAKREWVVAIPKDEKSPLLSLPDRRAIEVLTQHNCFWLGEHYGEHIGPKISALTQRALDEGIGRKALAEDLKRELGGVAPKDYRYWDVVSSSALVRARSFGTVSGMEEAKITEYEILAMGDERMCPICGEMNGRIFSVAETRKVINSVLSLTNPDVFKMAMPWQSKPAKGISNAKLCARGQSLPPFHGRCRCTLIMAGETSAQERENKVKALISSGVKTEKEAIAIGELLYDQLLGHVKDDRDTIDLRDEIIAEFKKYRDFGGTPIFQKGSSKDAAKRLNDVAQYYPSDWLDKINGHGGILAAATSRGYHQYFSGYHKIGVSYPKRLLHSVETAHHEMAHALENYFNSRDIEKNYYDRRTQNESLEKLAKLFPGQGYKRDEVTRKDQFAHAYMGRDYKGVAYEIFSMGTEGLMYNTYDMWHKDPESIKLMIGVFLGVGR
jgi:SPP1 gp7 family putative phage head morphogenesis protein